MVFELLHPRLRNVIAELGYGEPTEVQRLAIPRVLEGKNVLIIAPTGSGKTEAAMFPVISRILDDVEEGHYEGIKAIYITPMRALNRDLYHRLITIVEKCGLKIAVRHGDTPESERRRQAEEPPHILITTPETMQFLLVAPKMRRWLRNVRYVIVDEIHELINDKRGTQLSITLERLANLAGEFQRVGLSATIGNPELAAQFLVGVSRQYEIVHIPGLKNMRLKVHRPIPRDVDYNKASELSTVPEVCARLRSLDEEIRKYKTVLLFVNTRDTAELLGSRLAKYVNYDVGVYHGSLSREEREQLEAKLRSGKVKVVVTTSSLELGIDIGHIDAVIQYMSPRQVCRLIQRVGRSRHKLAEESIGTIITSDLDDTLESIVIAKSALEGKLEREIEYHEKALDVLAHQIVGIVLEARIDEREVTLDEIYKIVRRAHPYRNLSFDELVRVVKFMEERGYLEVNEDGRVRPRRGAYMYYIENASMIPDEVRYTAVDITSRKPVGELDEEFVSMIEVGSRIILAGRVWSIVNVDHKSRVVHLEPVQEVIGAVPAWIGEEIPVAYEIAQKVVELRECMLKEDVQKCIREFIHDAPLEVTDDTVKFLESEIDKARKSLDVYPSVDNVVIECTERVAVIHVGLGTKGNEALGLYLTRYLTRNYLLNVAYRTDPYRVILLFSRSFNPELIVKALTEVSESEVQETLIDAIRNSKLYKYRFAHVARRFGVLSKERVVDVNVNKLIEVFRGTVLDDETVNEILVDEVSLEVLLSFIRRVKNGEIKITLLKRQELSPLALSEEALYSKFEFTISAVPRHILVELVKRRLEERELTLICLKCGWAFRGKLRDVPDDLQCPVCGLRIITVLKYKHEDPQQVLRLIERVRKREPLSQEEQKYWNELRQRANVVLQFGKRGLYALAAHGIGSTTALRKVFSKIASSDEEFFMAILEAEKEYIKTRQFWNTK